MKSRLELIGALFLAVVMAACLGHPRFPDSVAGAPFIHEFGLVFVELDRVRQQQLSREAPSRHARLSLRPVPGRRVSGVLLRLGPDPPNASSSRTRNCEFASGLALLPNPIDRRCA
jgi:hypothetical protein